MTPKDLKSITSAKKSSLDVELEKRDDTVRVGDNLRNIDDDLYGNLMNAKESLNMERIDTSKIEIFIVAFFRKWLVESILTFF